MGQAKTDVWMPLYVGDYLADTSRLSTMEHGAYLLLIMDYWRNGPLPEDDKCLAQIARCSRDEWLVLRRVIQPYFQVVGAHWHHGRIDAEIARAADSKATAKARAEAGAAGRWGKTDATSNATSIPSSNAPSMPVAMLVSCPSPSPSEVSTKTLRPVAPDSDETFAAFWKAWPSNERKVAKVKCLAKWRQRGLAKQAEAILAHVRAMAGTQQWREFCPSPLTYINQSRWEDGLPAKASEQQRVAL